MVKGGLISQVKRQIFYITYNINYNSGLHDGKGNKRIMGQEKITSENLLENFTFLSDWEDRYGYLIELGKELSPMDEALKNENTLVRGCTSQVWMVQQGDGEQFFSFIADSDAHIVRGLIAILMIVYNKKSLESIQSFDIEDYFEKLGLSSHLSPNRRNGFFSMVERIKQLSARG